MTFNTGKGYFRLPQAEPAPAKPWFDRQSLYPIGDGSGKLTAQILQQIHDQPNRSGTLS